MGVVGIIPIMPIEVAWGTNRSVVRLFGLFERMELVRLIGVTGRCLGITGSGLCIGLPMPIGLMGRVESLAVIPVIDGLLTIHQLRLVAC